MSCSDPIADALTVIRNGLEAGKASVAFPFSKVKEGICKVLLEEGYLTRVDVLDTKPARSINFITLNFIATKTGVTFDESIALFRRNKT